MNEHRAENIDPELNELTQRIIGCIYKVSNTLGAGFLEKVYENALSGIPELRSGELPCKSRPFLSVFIRVHLWFHSVPIRLYPKPIMLACNFPSKVIFSLFQGGSQTCFTSTAVTPSWRPATSWIRALI